MRDKAGIRDWAVWHSKINDRDLRVPFRIGKDIDFEAEGPIEDAIVLVAQGARLKIKKADNSFFLMERGAEILGNTNRCEVKEVPKFPPQEELQVILQEAKDRIEAAMAKRDQSQKAKGAD